MKNFICSANTWSHVVAKAKFHVLRRACSVSDYRLQFPLCIFIPLFLCFTLKFKNETDYITQTALACLGMMPWVFCHLNTALTDLCGCQQYPLTKNLVSNCRHVCSIILRYLSSVYLRYHTSAQQNQCRPENVSKQIHVL